MRGMWDIFCRVIDNHGDLGVCVRLARQLAARGVSVRLWVDDASALAWMAPDVAQGSCPGLSVLPWDAASDAYRGADHWGDGVSEPVAERGAWSSRFYVGLWQWGAVGQDIALSVPASSRVNPLLQGLRSA